MKAIIYHNRWIQLFFSNRIPLKILEEFHSQNTSGKEIEGTDIGIIQLSCRNFDDESRILKEFATGILSEKQLILVFFNFLVGILKMRAEFFKNSLSLPYEQQLNSAK